MSYPQMSTRSNINPVDETTVRCRPCQQVFQVLHLTNPRRCPTCGGPTVSTAQLQQFQAATQAALKSLQHQSAWIMRITSLSMTSVQLMTYFFDDQEAGTFFNDVVTTAATAATVATEVWAYTGSRTWMILASACIQVAAILFFFVAMAFLHQFMPSRIALLVACMPLAGSLAAWHQFRAYTRIMRLDQKKA